jgi:mono/diheme cytochrome c family protein
MRTRMLSAALAAALAVLLTAQGCAKKEPETAGQTAAPPEAAAPAPSAAPAPAVAAAPAAATTAAAADTAAGAKVFQTFCQTCHGPAGKGDGLAAAGLNPKPANFAAGAFKYDANGNGTKGDIDDIKAIVHDGAAKHGGSPLMVPWPMLSADQLQAVAEYVKSLHTS